MKGSVVWQRRKSKSYFAKIASGGVWALDHVVREPTVIVKDFPNGYPRGGSTSVGSSNINERKCDMKKRYECSDCSKSSDDVQEIIDHIIEKHPNNFMAIPIDMKGSEV